MKIRYMGKNVETGEWVKKEFTLEEIEVGCIPQFCATENLCAKAVRRLPSTGLKDKYSKEIFRGDILSAGDGGFFEVIFVYAAWRFEATKKSRYISYPSPFSTAGRFEIIGNVYENPEMAQ